MIREAMIDDAAAIARVHVQTWRAAYANIMPAEFLAQLSEEQKLSWWRQHLAENRSVIFVAIEDNQVVGWASCGGSRDEDGEGKAELYAIYVASEFWGRGIGRALMMEIDAALAHVPVITLWVLEQNYRAQRFYRAAGFRADGVTKPIVIGGATLTEMRFVKRIRENQEAGWSGSR